MSILIWNTYLPEDMNHILNIVRPHVLFFLQYPFLGFYYPLLNSSVLTAACGVLIMSKWGMTLFNMLFEHAAIFIQK